MAEHVISLLKAIETCPEIAECGCLNTGYLDECHPLIQQAYNAAMDYLIKENGERNYSHELDLEDAGFRVSTYDDVDQLVWEKLLCNATFSGTCAVLEWTIGEVLAGSAIRVTVLTVVIAQAVMGMSMAVVGLVMVGHGHDNVDFSILLQETARDAGLEIKPLNLKISDGLES